jgi:hypothetical protein
MVYNSASRGPIEISEMGEHHIKACIKKLRAHRDLAQRGAAMHDFTQGAELAEMEKVAREKGWPVE